MASINLKILEGMAFSLVFYKPQKLSEKVNCQNINEVHEILHLFTKDLKIKAERESVKLNIVIEFFGDGQYKSQHFLSLENARVQKLVVCLGTPFSKTSHHITSEIN